MSHPTDHQPPTVDAPAGDARYSLAELTRAAGVSVRTVRYYIAEGLVPPPFGAGPRAAYGDGHLDRLRLIGRLKAGFLPLREIRRRLDALDDAQVRRLLATESGEGAEGTGWGLAAPRRADSAADYVARVLGGGGTPPSVANRAAREPPPAPVDAFAAETSLAFVSAPPAPMADLVAPSPPQLGRASPAASPFAALEGAAPAADPGTPPEPDAWRRVPLGDDAELLIRESAYRRRRDGVDWLVAWARKVFG